MLPAYRYPGAWCPALPRAPLVRAVIEDFITAADRALSGFIHGLDLVGSLALDDYRPGTGDIDFIAVTPARPDPGRSRPCDASTCASSGAIVARTSTGSTSPSAPSGAIRPWRSAPRTRTWGVLPCEPAARIR